MVKNFSRIMNPDSSFSEKTVSVNYKSREFCWISGVAEFQIADFGKSSNDIK
ncbi:MAG: hypothetical protein F6K40_04895 [Okeania sp. SIO3I5]|uniref:hypothetical protein n=1 Tax=Okeania sp. SIO3I5 TaxID=2607805 RepID=UPI0013BD6F94|nr:hypothetical protein [Okeania sp. SIO3I5]NEQ35665.1 hypothetical protein [Okeania sp. SIO3I5]